MRTNNRSEIVIVPIIPQIIRDEYGTFNLLTYAVLYIIFNILSRNSNGFFNFRFGK